MAVQLHVGFTYGTYTKIFEEVDRLTEINMELLWSEYPAKVLWDRDFPTYLLGRQDYHSTGKAALPVYKVTALFQEKDLGTVPGHGQTSSHQGEPETAQGDRLGSDGQGLQLRDCSWISVLLQSGTLPGYFSLPFPLRFRQS